MSEREIIEVCNSAGLITADMFRTYVEKLGKRNSAAHPSETHVTQVQAEGYIDDLIRNTVLLLIFNVTLEDPRRCTGNTAVTSNGLLGVAARKGA
jgi:hypothetical protein